MPRQANFLDMKPTGKRPFRIPRMKLIDMVEKVLKAKDGRSNWKGRKSDKENWRTDCMVG